MGFSVSISSRKEAATCHDLGRSSSVSLPLHSIDRCSRLHHHKDRSLHTTDYRTCKGCDLYIVAVHSKGVVFDYRRIKVRPHRRDVEEATVTAARKSTRFFHCDKLESSLCRGPFIKTCENGVSFSNKTTADNGLSQPLGSSLFGFVAGLNQSRLMHQSLLWRLPRSCIHSKPGITPAAGNRPEHVQLFHPPIGPPITCWNDR